MSSSSLLSNLTVSRLQGVRSLSNLTVPPKPGDIYSSGKIRLNLFKITYNSLTNKHFREKKKWQGIINININNVIYDSNYSLYRIYSQINFIEDLNSEISIPNMNSYNTTDSTVILDEEKLLSENYLEISSNFLFLVYYDNFNIEDYTGLLPDANVTTFSGNLNSDNIINGSLRFNLNEPSTSQSSLHNTIVGASLITFTKI